MEIKSSTKTSESKFFTWSLVIALLLAVISSGVLAQPAPTTPEPSSVKTDPAPESPSPSVTDSEGGSVEQPGEELQSPTESEELSQLNTESEDKPDSSLWGLLVKGGWTMLGLALISAIIIGFIMERTYLMRRKKISISGYNSYITSLISEGDLDKLRKSLAEDERLISNILSQGLEKIDQGADKFEQEILNTSTVELGTLERGLNLLSGLGNLAPLLGFFGTVVGMRNSFLQFVEKAAPTAQDLAGGVEEALITTAAGLLIAIPTYLIHNLFVYMIDSLTIELERSSNLILKRFK